MYDDKAREYLKTHFNTSEIGDCRHCSYSNNRESYNKLPCGQFKCIMLTKLEMFEAERQYRQQSEEVPPHLKNMMHKIAKMRLLGFTEEIVPPWIIMHDQSKENSGWFNSKTQVYGKKMYKSIIPSKNMLICINDFRLTKSSKVCDVDIFSMRCGELNLAIGIPNLVYKIKTSGLFYNDNRNQGFVVCEAKDTDSNQKVSIIISEFGNRLAVIKDNRMRVSRTNDTILVELPTFKQVLRLTPTLDVIYKTPSAIALAL